VCFGGLLVGVIEAEEAERARATARERSAILAQMSRQATPAELCICTPRSQPVFGGVCVHVPQVHPPTSVAPGRPLWCAAGTAAVHRRLTMAQCTGAVGGGLALEALLVGAAFIVCVWQRSAENARLSLAGHGLGL
jgi:hypothetical protein